MPQLRKRFPLLNRNHHFESALFITQAVCFLFCNPQYMSKRFLKSVLILQCFSLV
ncbi:hypothetical protein MUS_1132 [Bacillus velezensis YAU B9601-Y2]|uniref:Uncharacterized protein n=1 Tax=Bacillus amyloliquefaciens (strain Y2) TaxID=1155777 RepID=I2C3D7_BACAY|nr:hypothetical protein MUS_1132 [Bacillus velezensis YAU B9601-Y2]